MTAAQRLIVWSCFFASLCHSDQTEDQMTNEVRWNIFTSAYTRHYHASPAHNNHQQMIGIERQVDSSLWGFAAFKNSFYQKTQMAYWAKDFSLQPWIPINGLRSKIIVGLIHGYKGQHQHKIPFNQWKVAPAAIPTLGLSYRHFETDILFLGLNAVTLTVGTAFSL